VTLSFGLAFSALLAAIYVPALIGIGILIGPLQPSASSNGGDSDEKNADTPEVDPLRRIAAIIATLSPLLAGLLANAFASG
jgi:hypothetical protein